ncbi:hypothetical protein F1880_001314 [Penicillium rolfsii]|nr:hypothetical protein F1880_001314 [Penicillium rolfsii]
MLSRYPPHPRLTRLDTKSRSSSSLSSLSSADMSDVPVSVSRPSSTAAGAATMTDLVTPSDQPAPGEEASSRTATARFPPKMDDSLHLLDLEFMMHWCTSTYRSMARDHAAEALWQMAIPQLSLQFPALRHGLLALSALQLARDTTNAARKWRYLVSAREHQAHALAGVQFDSADDLTTAQCNAAFALCCVLVVFPFAYCLIDDSEDEDEKERPQVLDEFLEVFGLTRWLVGTMILLMDRVGSDELHPLVRPASTRPTMPDMSQLVISALKRRNRAEAERDPSHEADVYEQALEHLHYSLERLMGGGDPKDFAFCWAFRIPVRFQDLVRAKEPFALVILAHYAVVLHHMHQSWWMGNWGTLILKEIADCLDHEWRELICWPIDATGCLVPEV